MDSKFFIPLPSLNFPEKYHFRLKEKGSQPSIFCTLRKKWFILTPEEWVRQHAIHFLIDTLCYSSSAMKAEHPVLINGLNQRIDILVYTKGDPLILVECKSPDIPITQKTLDQALRYNVSVQSKYIYLTNGIQHIYAKKNGKGFDFLKELPKR